MKNEKELSFHILPYWSGLLWSSGRKAIGLLQKTHVCELGHLVEGLYNFGPKISDQDFP